MNLLYLQNNILVLSSYVINNSELTFWSLTASYRSANLQTLHFKYLFNKYT